MKELVLYAVVALALLVALSAQALAASSPFRTEIPLGGSKYLQFRGVDRPHGYRNFSSWPGYDSFVHSNCYHVHGEFKKRDSSGREYYSKSVSIPVYCKGTTKYVLKAFKYAANKLDISFWKFAKIGGVLFTIIDTIPTVGGPTQECRQNSTRNSTYCYWVDD